MRTKVRLLFLFFYLLLALLHDDAVVHVHAWNVPPVVDRVRNDFLALTRRVTARHILLPPNRELALTIKHKIRQKCCEEEDNPNDESGRLRYPYVVDVFAKAAAKYSRDETTKDRGGLLGELVPQGYCRDPVLDRACFEVSLGEIEGPIESDYGYHLLLVEERTNCPKLDGRNTKLVPCQKHGFGRVVPSEQVGRIDFSKLLRDQVVFWLVACVAGGVVAELSASLGNSIAAT